MNNLSVGITCSNTAVDMFALDVLHYAKMTALTHPDRLEVDAMERVRRVFFPSAFVDVIPRC